MSSYISSWEVDDSFENGPFDLQKWDTNVQFIILNGDKDISLHFYQKKLLLPFCILYVFSSRFSFLCLYCRKNLFRLNPFFMNLKILN